jgi:hypothetical protein
MSAYLEETSPPHPLKIPAQQEETAAQQEETSA